MQPTTFLAVQMIHVWIWSVTPKHCQHQVRNAKLMRQICWPTILDHAVNVRLVCIHDMSVIRCNNFKGIQPPGRIIRKIVLTEDLNLAHLHKLPKQIICGLRQETLNLSATHELGRMRQHNGYLAKGRTTHKRIFIVASHTVWTMKGRELPAARSANVWTLTFRKQHMTKLCFRARRLLMTPTNDAPQIGIELISCQNKNRIIHGLTMRSNVHSLMK